MIEWIPVTERLPDSDRDVLVWCPTDGFGVHRGWYENENIKDDHWWVDRDLALSSGDEALFGPHCRTHAPSHWAELNPPIDSPGMDYGRIEIKEPCEICGATHANYFAVRDRGLVSLCPDCSSKHVSREVIQPTPTP